MRTETVHEYLARPWARLERARYAHWAREHRRDPGVTMRVSMALWRQMRALRPDWPSAEERRSDLAHHRRLRDLLDRVAHSKPTR